MIILKYQIRISSIQNRAINGPEEGDFVSTLGCEINLDNIIKDNMFEMTTIMRETAYRCYAGI